jgi:hypothetical protein
MEQKSSVLVLLDVDLLCESLARPSDRRPPLPEGVVQRLLRGVVQGRGAQNKDGEYCELMPGDVYALFDGTREHLHKVLLEAFTPKNMKAGPDASVKVFNLFVSEQSLRARKIRIRGSEPITQRQCMLAVSAKPLVPDAIPEKEHNHYHGTNRGDVIGLIDLDPLEKAWKLPLNAKKLVYGDRLVSVGGKAKDKDTRSRRQDDALEPVFYHHLPCSFYQNLVTTMSATAILDLAAGPGEAAKSALVMKRPYWGLCLSEQHVTMLYRHLVHWVLLEMGSEGSLLFNPTYAGCKGLTKETAGGVTPPSMAAPRPELTRKPGQKLEMNHTRHSKAGIGRNSDEPHKRRRVGQGTQCEAMNAPSSPGFDDG